MPPPPSMEDHLQNRDTNYFKALGLKGIRFLTNALEIKSIAKNTVALVDMLPFGLNTWVASHVSLDDSYNSRSYERSANAATMLCALGQDAAPAAPAVLAILKSPASDSWLKQNCAEILGSIGPKSKPAIPMLLTLTTNNDFVAQVAALALWKIARQTNVLVEVISNRLLYAGRMRASVLPYFQDLGHVLLPAAPVIERALYNSDERVRSQAEEILGKIDPDRLHKDIQAANRDASQLLLTHIEAMNNGNRTERLNALDAIAVFGRDATNAVPSLVLMLETLENELQIKRQPAQLPFRAKYELHQCLGALAEIGPTAHMVTPELVRLLDQSRTHGVFGVDNFPDVADVCHCLGRMGPDAAEAVPALKKVLTNSMVVSRDERSFGHRRLEEIVGSRQKEPDYQHYLR